MDGPTLRLCCEFRPFPFTNDKVCGSDAFTDFTIILPGAEAERMVWSFGQAENLCVGHHFSLFSIMWPWRWTVVWGSHPIVVVLEACGWAAEDNMALFSFSRWTCCLLYLSMLLFRKAFLWLWDSIRAATSLALHGPNVPFACIPGVMPRGPRYHPPL